MLRNFPSRKRLFLKIDSDTLLLPPALLAFLSALHGGTPKGVPLYFGSNRIASKTRFCTGRNCFLRSWQWRALAANITSRSGSSSSSGSTSFCESDEPSYAQGGAYGFDRRALTLLASDNCLERVFSAIAAFDKQASPQLFEDEAVGLCMRLHNAPRHLRLLLRLGPLRHQQVRAVVRARYECESNLPSTAHGAQAAPSRMV